MKKVKFAIADFDEKMGQIDDSNLEWKVGTIEQAERVVIKDRSKCVLFYYGDVQRGCPVNKEATREEFESNPAVLGICFYHCWRGYQYE